MWPLGQGIILPQGESLNNFGIGLLGNATYQISSGFREEDFFKFSSWKSIFSLCNGPKPFLQFL